MKNKTNLLLLNSPPLVLQKELAVILGLDQAIVIQQIHYWLEINTKSNKNYHDNYHWTYNSFSQWQTQFPFWSISKIKRLFKALITKKLLISRPLKNSKFDRTLSYRIDYKKLDSLIANPNNDRQCHFDTIHSVSLTPCITETSHKKKTGAKQIDK